MIYFWIAFGSAIGGVCRYVAGISVARWMGLGFPWGTLLVNITGCAVIGWVAALNPSERQRAFVMIGICGGFTTFSSFSLETLNLVRVGEPLRAVAYVVASLAFCMIGVVLGNVIGTALHK